MKKKTIIRLLLTLFAVSLVLCLFSACHQKSSSEGGEQLSAEDSAKKMAVDTIASEAKEEVKDNSALFTYTMAMEILHPKYKSDEKFFTSLFDDLNLPMLCSERYIWDEEWGGDDPAIRYCFGDNVKYEDFEIKPTGKPYYGVQFYFFFDESRKTGWVKLFHIITSDDAWYEKFMADMKADGQKFVSNDVYGKKGKMYRKEADPDENAPEQPYYYVYDYSTEGAYDVEVSYEDGADL